MKPQKYKSRAQMAMMHSLAEQGKIDKKVIAKMDKASEGKNLPEHAHNIGKPNNVRTIKDSYHPKKV